MLTVANVQFTQVQDSNRKLCFACLHISTRVCSWQATYTSREGGLIKEAIIHMQELDSQRGEGA